MMNNCLHKKKNKKSKNKKIKKIKKNKKIKKIKKNKKKKKSKNMKTAFAAEQAAAQAAAQAATAAIKALHHIVSMERDNIRGVQNPLPTPKKRRSPLSSNRSRQKLRRVDCSSVQKRTQTKRRSPLSSNRSRQNFYGCSRVQKPTLRKKRRSSVSLPLSSKHSREDRQQKPLTTKRRSPVSLAPNPLDTMPLEKVARAYARLHGCGGDGAMYHLLVHKFYAAALRKLMFQRDPTSVKDFRKLIAGIGMTRAALGKIQAGCHWLLFENTVKHPEKLTNLMCMDESTTLKAFEHVPVDTVQRPICTYDVCILKKTGQKVIVLGVRADGSLDFHYLSFVRGILDTAGDNEHYKSWRLHEHILDELWNKSRIPSRDDLCPLFGDDGNILRVDLRNDFEKIRAQLLAAQLQKENKHFVRELRWHRVVRSGEELQLRSANANNFSKYTFVEAANKHMFPGGALLVIETCGEKSSLKTLPRSKFV